MQTLDWLHSIIEQGKLCDTYTEKVDVAKSKKQLADIGLDYNGASFLCEMENQGMPLNYDVLKREFRAFINGRYYSENETSGGSVYTVGLWCQCDEKEVTVKTTVATFLDCDVDVIVPNNHYAILFVDSNCKIRVFCGSGSICKVNYWGNAKIENPENNSKIKISKRNE